MTRRRFRRDPTHALFADQSQSIPDNLVALFGRIRPWNYSAETARSAVGCSPRSGSETVASASRILLSSGHDDCNERPKMGSQLPFLICPLCDAHVLKAVGDGLTPRRQAGPLSSVLKVKGTELLSATTQLAMDVGGRWRCRIGRRNWRRAGNEPESGPE